MDLQGFEEKTLCFSRMCYHCHGIHENRNCEHEVLQFKVMLGGSVLRVLRGMLLLLEQKVLMIY